MQLALAGKPALAALRLAVDLSGSATCKDLGVLNDLMLASDSHGWLLEVVGEETLKANQRCLAPPVLLAWAREKLRALDPAELPKPEEMLHGDSDRVEFVYEDEGRYSLSLRKMHHPQSLVRGNLVCRSRRGLRLTKRRLSLSLRVEREHKTLRLCRPVRSQYISMPRCLSHSRDRLRRSVSIYGGTSII